MSLLWKTLFLLIGCLPFRAVLADEALPTVRLATDDYPPYSSASLPGGGLSVSLLRQAFATAGYRLDVVFMSRQQAIKKGGHDPAYAGYFPASLSAVNRRQCYLSPRYAEADMVLLEHKPKEIVLSSLQQLAHYRIGIIAGLVYGDDFLASLTAVKPLVDTSSSEEQAVRKLVNDEIQLLAIDQNVMRWLLNYSPVLAGYAGDIGIAKLSIGKPGLYVCFQRSGHGQQQGDSLTRGLRGLDLSVYSKKYMNELGLN